jgi:serine/threonine protein kinase
MSSASPQNPQGLVGTTVGNSYILERVLGQGRHGALFEARHSRLACRFAVRIIHLDGNKRSNLLGALSRQGGMTHPHLNPPRDVMVLPEDQLLIASPLLNGQDLNQRVAARGKLTATEGVVMMRQAASGLHALHQQSLTHGNLTATNVFFVRFDDVSVENALGDGKGSQGVQLIDGGLALIDGNNATPADDQRSLGRIILAFVADLSAEQRQVLERTQEARPEARFASVSELWRAFDEAKGSRSQSVRARSVATDMVAHVKGPRRRPPPRRTLILGGAAALGLVTVAAVIAIGSRKPPPPPPSIIAEPAASAKPTTGTQPSEPPSPPKAAAPPTAGEPTEASEPSSEKRSKKKRKSKRSH